MLSKEHRFHTASSLRYVHARGVVTRGPQFSLKVARNNRRSSFRAAVIVSKKVSKSAVVRNRIRRRLYELIRKHQEMISEPYDILVLVYDANVATIASDKLEKQFTHQIKKAQIS